MKFEARAAGRWPRARRFIDVAWSGFLAGADRIEEDVGPDRGTDRVGLEPERAVSGGGESKAVEQGPRILVPVDAAASSRSRSSSESSRPGVSRMS